MMEAQAVTGTPRKLVLVSWNDAQDFEQSWVGEADATKFGEEDCRILSVGWVISDTAKYLTIGGDWHATESDYGRVTKIPKGMVISMVELQEIVTDS